MTKDYDAFIATINSPNTAKVASSFKSIGEFSYDYATMIDVENIILNLKPKSPKAITTICYVLSSYAKYIGNNDLLYMAQDIDRKSLWIKAKPFADKKFISYSTFNSICSEIDKYEEYNSLYIKTLFRSVYEGIYNDDMSFIKNLKASDIKGNTVTLRGDCGKVCELNITDSLAKDLVALGDIDIHERRNRYGTCKIKTVGLHKDSCFKVENRNGSSEYQGRFSYYRVLRNISKEYLQYNLLPLQLYISGIMYRIKTRLKGQGIALEDAFADKNKNRNVSRIIAEELKASNYDIEVRNFREIVQGHISVFSD